MGVLSRLFGICVVLSISGFVKACNFTRKPVDPHPNPTAAGPGNQILPDGIYACNRRCNDFCTVVSGSVYKCQIQNCCVMSDIEGTFEDRFNDMDPYELITQFACGKSCGNSRCKRIESDTFFYCDHRKCCTEGALTTPPAPATTRPTTTQTPKPTTSTTPTPRPTTTTTQTPKPTTPNTSTPPTSMTTNPPSPNTNLVCLACRPGNHTFCQEKFSYGTMCRDVRNTGGRYGCCVSEGGVVPPPPVHVYAPDELRNIPRAVNARGYSNREKKAIVDALNYNRSLIARGLYKVNGLPIPPAVGMYKMKWSKELEDGAQDYADYCFNVHSQNTSYGETLSKVHEDYIEGTGESAISRYFVEFQTYNYTPGQPYNFADGMGHGYLSAWYYVSEVGCGVRYCDDMFVHTVCHFAPAAPWPGRIMYEAGPTCSKCETAAVDNGTKEPLKCEEETGLCVPKSTT